jgi:Domain of unknown function (DUF4949)
MKNNILLAASFVLSCSSVTYAMSNNPDSCPSVSTIKAVAPQIAFKDEDGNGYSTYSVDNYGTEFRWNFVISKIEADSTNDALGKGAQGLVTLSGNPPPLSLGDLWFCIYSMDYGYSAVAFEPSFFYAKKAVELAHKYVG